jgi:hypothetical protein
MRTIATHVTTACVLSGLLFLTMLLVFGVIVGMAMGMMMMSMRSARGLAVS